MGIRHFCRPGYSRNRRLRLAIRHCTQRVCHRLKLSLLSVVSYRHGDNDYSELWKEDRATLIIGPQPGSPLIRPAQGNISMKSALLRPGSLRGISRKLVSIICTLVLLAGDMQWLAAQQPASKPDQAKFSSDQLDSLVAPIALYPDPLLAQTLAASTYPLEIIQLHQWLQKNKNLKDKALADAAAKQPWDPSVQALAGLPDVVKRLADDVQWTTELGNAFLAQQSEVMDAVQRMRKKAQDKGNLKSSEQQKVETKVVESKQVIIVEQANPQVVYVPSYDPVVVYGAPAYPYPPIYYPPPGYYAAGMAISFGVGVAMGAVWSGGWGWGCGWGGNNDITVNRNNNFNRNTNIQGGNRANTLPARGNNWQHNPQHRGGTPYGNRETANRYGGTARGDSMATRRENARQNQGQLGGRQQAGNTDRGSRGNSDRTGGAANRQPSASDRSANRGDRSGGDRASGDRGGGDRAGGDRGGSGDRVGNRSTSSSGTAGRGSSAFGGSGSRSGSSARASSSRGSSSFSGSRGGGSRGGGRRR